MAVQNTVHSIIRGSGTTTIANFKGIGRGVNPSAAVLADADILKLSGIGLSARSMKLTQVGNDVEVTFDGITDTKIILQNLLLDELDSLTKATGASVDFSNIIFDGETAPFDSFDVLDSDRQLNTVFNPNSVTFLNDRNNNTKGRDNSNDVINGLGGDDVLDGLGGDDLLRGGTGNDLLFGGSGNDTLQGDEGNDQLFGGDGNDVLEGGANNDQLDGGGGNDFINGGDGDDVILGSTGSDVILGGAGFDRLSYQDLANPTDLVFYMEPRISVSQSSSPPFGGGYTLTTSSQLVVKKGTTRDSISGVTISPLSSYYNDANANERFTPSGIGQVNVNLSIERLEGASGQINTIDFSTIIRDSRTITFPPPGPRVTLSTFNAAPAINVDLAAETLTFKDKVLQVSNFSRVLGSQFDDVIAGGGSNDILVGNDGNDILTASRFGNTSMTGGLGSDTFNLLQTDRFNTILDFGNGGDRINLSGFAGSLGAGPLDPSRFVLGGTPTTGTVSYNSGALFVGNTLIAQLTNNPNLQASNIFVS
jgi:Ca2+-binding RTX toxin-like protein